MRQGFLFWGTFLILLGAVPLAVQAGWIDREALSSTWRLWPIALVALGVAVILGRSRLAVVGTLTAALVLGVGAGAALAVGPGWIGMVGGDCSSIAARAERTTAEGELRDGAVVSLDFNCGALTVTGADGGAWTFAATHAGDAPEIDASQTELAIEAGGDGVAFFGGNRRQEWQVTLPTEPTVGLEVETNAAETRLDLAGMRLDEAAVSGNAGDVTIDLADAEVAGVDLSVNAGSMAVILDGAARGALSVNAGSLELCVPESAAMSLDVSENVTFGHNLDEQGLSRSGETWTTAGYAPGPDAIELEVDGNAASLTLNPEGGCR